MTDKQLIAIICSGWLSNKYAACNMSNDTAREAYRIAKEIIRLTNEDKDLRMNKEMI